MRNDTASGGFCFPRPFNTTSSPIPAFPHSRYVGGPLSSAVGPYIEGTFCSVRRR